jgi:hypothetical protein
MQNRKKKQKFNVKIKWKLVLFKFYIIRKIKCIK